MAAGAIRIDLDETARRAAKPCSVRDSSIDRFDQLMGWERLMQKCHAAGLEGLTTDGFVIKRRHEDDRKFWMGHLQLPPQFNAGHAFQMNIYEKAINSRCLSAAKEFFS
jgi:hypothetical protein